MSSAGMRVYRSPAQTCMCAGQWHAIPHSSLGAAYDITRQITELTPENTST